MHDSRAKTVMRRALGFFLIGAGVAHFAARDFYLRMMPPYLPWHRELVFLSGACEVFLGAAFFVPRFVVPAAWGTIALLVAVFPANIHMAVHPELFPNIPPVALWARLPLQAVLIVWASRFTRGESLADQTHPR